MKMFFIFIFQLNNTVNVNCLSGEKGKISKQHIHLLKIKIHKRCLLCRIELSRNHPCVFKHKLIFVKSSRTTNTYHARKMTGCQEKSRQTRIISREWHLNSATRQGVESLYRYWRLGRKFANASGVWINELVEYIPSFFFLCFCEETQN